MVTNSIPTTNADTTYTQLADTDGRLWLGPTAAVNMLLAAGHTTLQVVISLCGATPPRPWLTASAAARLLTTDVDGLTFEAARRRVIRACDAGEITNQGDKGERRVDPVSLDAWRLGQRERNLDELG